MGDRGRRDGPQTADGRPRRDDGRWTVEVVHGLEVVGRGLL